MPGRRRRRGPCSLLVSGREARTSPSSSGTMTRASPARRRDAREARVAKDTVFGPTTPAARKRRFKGGREACLGALRAVLDGTTPPKLQPEDEVEEQEIFPIALTDELPEMDAKDAPNCPCVAFVSLLTASQRRWSWRRKRQMICTAMSRMGAFGGFALTLPNSRHLLRASSSAFVRRMLTPLRFLQRVAPLAAKEKRATKKASCGKIIPCERAASAFCKRSRIFACLLLILAHFLQFRSFETRRLNDSKMTQGHSLQRL